jgi:hypothetical protein
MYQIMLSRTSILQTSVAAGRVKALSRVLSSSSWNAQPDQADPFSNYMVKYPEPPPGRNPPPSQYQKQTQPQAQYNQSSPGSVDRAKQLLSQPLGTMESVDWPDAKRCLFDLTKRQRDYATADALLDRLYEEQCLAPVPEPYSAAHYAMILECLNKTELPNKSALADQIFDKAQARYDLHPHHQPEPDTAVYNALIHCHATSKDPNATTRVEQIIAKMQDLASRNHPLVRPQLWSYNAVCLAHANRKGEYGSAKKAEDWLLKMATMETNDGTVIQPDIMTFNMILKAWKNSGERRGPDRAMEILRLMVKLYADGSSAVPPDAISFNTVMHAYAEQGRGADATEALEYIKTVVKEHQLRVDLTTSYNAAIHAWDNSRDKNAGTHAEQLLKRMFADSRDDHVIVKPNELAMYNTLSSFVKAKKVQEAEALLCRIIETYQNGEHTIVPTTNLCNCVVRGWIRLDQEGTGAERAEQLLNDMMDLAVDLSFRTWPDQATFNLVIDGYRAQPGNEHSVRRIIGLVAKMEECYDAGYKQCQPSSFSYFSILDKILKVEPNPELTIVAVDMLKRLENNYNTDRDNKKMAVKPDVIMYNMVIHILSRVGDEYCKKEVTDILSRMESKFHDGQKDVEPCNITYTMVAKTFANHPTKEDFLKMSKLSDQVKRISDKAGRRLKLDEQTIQSFLVFFKNSQHARAAYKAEEILEGHNLDEFHPQMARDMLSCGILAFAQIPEGTHVFHAAKLLLKNIQKYDAGETKVIPSPQAFTMVIRTLQNSKAKHGYKRPLHLANEIYDHATRLLGENEVSPALHFAMIHNLTKVGYVKDASAILAKRMAVGDTRIASSPHVWHNIVHGYSRQRARTLSNALAARAFFDSMLTTPGAPKADVNVYNSVMNAAIIPDTSSEQNKETAWKVVEQTFNELQAAHKPDHVSYAILAKAHRCLLPRGELQYIKVRDLFLQCRENGCVGPAMLSEARFLPKEWRADLFGDFDLSTYDGKRHRECVPEEWTKGIARNTYRDIS